jgi:hypothetical protein
MPSANQSAVCGPNALAGADVLFAQTLKSDGSFAGLADLAPYADINDFLAADLRPRQT